jgi:hypothetical protein
VAKYGGSDSREKLEADAAARKEVAEDVDEHEDSLIIAMQSKKWTGTPMLRPAASSLTTKTSGGFLFKEISESSHLRNPERQSRQPELR